MWFRLISITSFQRLPDLLHRFFVRDARLVAQLGLGAGDGEAVVGGNQVESFIGDGRASFEV